MQVALAARAGYAGPDHVKYEVTSENGEVATYDVTITVTAAQPGQSPPAGAQGLGSYERRGIRAPRAGRSRGQPREDHR